MATINGTNGNDNLRGATAADRINGRAGDDVLNGLGGNDTLDGGDGVDTLRGGAGDDLYLIVYKGGNHDVVFDTAGFDTVIATNSDFVLGAGLEVLIMRGDEGPHPSFPNLILQGIGNELDNTIRNERTGTQRVYLDGHGGDDVLLGNDGVDWFSFHVVDSESYGNDYADGGGGDRDIMSVGHDSAIVVDFVDGFARGGGVGGSGTITFLNIEQITSGQFNDRIAGDSRANTIYAGGGNDTVSAGAGNDAVHADVRVWPDMSGEYEGRDRLSGGAGHDTLKGGAGADFLDGGAGNDWMDWDSADRAVRGGSGNDALLVRESLDLRNISQSLITDVETIDMSFVDRSGAADHRLTLTARDLLDLSSTTDTLKVLGESGDSVDIVGAFADMGVSGGYHRYKVGAGTLLVDTDITNVA